MARRLPPTMTDYVVIAINPALIMLLITSLVYFLLELFYQGNYPERLHFCLWWFIFGIVLISRISMEEGWDRARPSARRWRVVVAMALNKFVSYRGTNLSEVGWMINYSLMALIWWCAHQLTWDCTLMDEDLDSSGEGLLQTAGLELRPREQENNAESPAPNQQDGKPDDLLDATAIAAIAGASLSWRQFVERRRRPHAPGVWVVYFSLAALPLFGVGQAFVPAANAESRRNAFLLLCVYVASGLGLLLTTSFLNLRRYLRQRRLEMPLAMAGTWLTMGAILIVSLLFLAALLPRPEAEYTISELPGAVSEEQASAQAAAGQEGTKNGAVESGSGKRTGAGEEESKSNGAPQGQPTQGKEKDRDSASKGGQSSSSKNSQSGKTQQENAGSKQPGELNQPGEPQQATESHDQPVLEINPTWIVSESILSRVKWLFYGALGLLVLYWSWRYREELLAWLMSLLGGFSWGQLDGGREKPAAKAIPIRRKSFFDYPDPFASGLAARRSPEELVRYSFEAFEAWGRDHGWPRREDQTANEFARQMGVQVNYLAAPAKALADLYSRAAYAPGTLPPTSIEQLRLFWQTIPRTASTASGAFPS